MNVQLKKGVMEIVVLSMLQRKDFYGYELVTEISKYIEMSEGTIYPLLNRFKKDGLVDTYLAESHNGPPRKYYRITDAGRAEFQESVKEWTPGIQQSCATTTCRRRRILCVKVNF